MRLGEIKQRVKRQFGDESGALIDDDDIIAWANEAQRDIIRKTRCLADSAYISVVAGTDSYDLPSNFLVAASVLLDGRKLTATTREEIDLLDPYRDTPDVIGDTPTRYYIWGQQLYLYPKPIADSTNGVRIFYAILPSTLINDDNIPEIPEQMHMDIVRYCLSMAKELNEDIDGAGRIRTEYENRIALSMDEAKGGNEESFPAVRCLPGDY